jgi:hypothetical protein
MTKFVYYFTLLSYLPVMLKCAPSTSKMFLKAHSVFITARKCSWTTFQHSHPQCILNSGKNGLNSDSCIFLYSDMTRRKRTCILCNQPCSSFFRINKIISFYYLNCFISIRKDNLYQLNLPGASFTMLTQGKSKVFAKF